LSGDTYTSNKIYIREGLSYYDPLVFSSVGGYRRHYLYDGLGSTRQLLNDAQNTTDTYSYEAFGNSIGSTGTTSNPYKYVGSLGYYSPSAAGGSSLQHLGARYYMPDIGRFITQDPLGIGNPYAYCDNNPIAYVDPEGLWWLAWDESVWQQLKSSTAATFGGVATGATLGLWRPNWSDPCDPYGGFSRGMGIGAGGLLAGAAYGYLGTEAVGQKAFQPFWRYVSKAELDALKAGAQPGRWMVRGRIAPYSVGEAQKLLQLAEPAADVIPVRVPWWKFIAGPGRVPNSPVDALEWYRGWRIIH